MTDKILLWMLPAVVTVHVGGAFAAVHPPGTFGRSTDVLISLCMLGTPIVAAAYLFRYLRRATADGQPRLCWLVACVSTLVLWFGWLAMIAAVGAVM